MRQLTVVPRVRMKIYAFPRRNEESSHVLGPHVVAVLAEAEVHHERDRPRWKEELGPIGMIVAHPEVNPFAAAGGFGVRSLLGDGREAVQVGIVFARDGEVLAVKEVALPVDFKVTLRCASLIATIRIELTPSLSQYGGQRSA